MTVPPAPMFGPPRFADSRTGAQAALYWITVGALYPSASQILHAEFGCHTFLPDSPGTRTGRSSATTASTLTSTARSQPRATTPRTPPHAGHKPTAPPPTKPPPSP